MSRRIRASLRPHVRATLAAVKASRASKPSQDTRFPGGIQQTLLSLKGSASPDAYSTHEAVYRCVTLISRSLAGVPLRVRRGTRENGGTFIDSGPWYDLLLRPNTKQTRREFVEATLTWWLLDGLVYWAQTRANGEPTSKGEAPTYLWPIRRTNVRKGDGGAWVVRDPTTGASAPYPQHAIIPFRFFDPSDPEGGLTPLGACSSGYRADLKAAAFTEALYENGADPGGVLWTEQSLGRETRQEMRTEWEDRHKGESKAGRIAVLEGGLKYQQMQVNARDLQYIESRKLSRQQVATVYGVPLFFLNEQADYAYASARAAVRILWENTLLPMGGMVSDVAEGRLFFYIDTSLYLEFDTAGVEALRDDLTSRLDSVDKMRRSGVPVNEALERMNIGVGPVEGGDVPLVEQALAPLAMVASGELAGGGMVTEVSGDPGAPPTNPDATPQEDKPGGATKGTPAPLPKVEPSAGDVPTVAADAAAEGVNPAQTAMNGAQVGSMVDVAVKVAEGTLPPASAVAILTVAYPLTEAQAQAIVAPAAALQVENEAEAPEPPEGAPPPPPPPGAGEQPEGQQEEDAEDGPPRARAREADPRWARTFTRVMRPGEAQYLRRFKGWLHGRRAEVLRALEGMDRALDSAAFTTWMDEARERWRKGLKEQMHPLYRKTATAAISDIASELGKGVNVTMTSPAMLEFLARKEVLLQGVSDRVLENVRGAVLESLAAGGSVRDVQDTVRGTFDTTRARAAAVARTETAQTVNGSRYEVMRAEGIKRTEWLTQGFGVREEHVPLNRETRALGESFVDGITLRFPGDTAAPARYVVNCRCIPVPVLED